MVTVNTNPTQSKSHGVTFELYAHLKNFISDDSTHYHLTGTSHSCSFWPSLQSADVIDLENCTAMGSSGHGREPAFLFRVFNLEKRGIIKVTIKGVAIDCSPGDGILMTAISSSGKPIHCKTFAGYSNIGIMACTYQCLCHSGCIMFRATIADPANKIICAFEV